MRCGHTLAASSLDTNALFTPESSLGPWCPLDSPQKPSRSCITYSHPIRHTSLHPEYLYACVCREPPLTMSSPTVLSLLPRCAPHLLPSAYCLFLCHPLLLHTASRAPWESMHVHVGLTGQISPVNTTHWSDARRALSDHSTPANSLNLHSHPVTGPSIGPHLWRGKLKPMELSKTIIQLFNSRIRI